MSGDPELDEDLRLCRTAYRVLDFHHKSGVVTEPGDIVILVIAWLHKLSTQAETDGATVAPEVIDKIIEGLQEGRL